MLVDQLLIRIRVMVESISESMHGNREFRIVIVYICI